MIIEIAKTGSGPGHGKIWNDDHDAELCLSCVAGMGQVGAPLQS